MNIRVLSFEPSDGRTLSEIPQGEAVEDDVLLEVGGVVRRFTVTVHAHVPTHGVSLVSASESLCEVLQEKPVALAQISRLCGKLRRGEPVTAPIVIETAQALWAEA